MFEITTNIWRCFLRTDSLNSCVATVVLSRYFLLDLLLACGSWNHFIFLPFLLCQVKFDICCICVRMRKLLLWQLSCLRQMRLVFGRTFQTNKLFCTIWRLNQIHVTRIWTGFRGRHYDVWFMWGGTGLSFRSKNDHFLVVSNLLDWLWRRRCHIRLFLKTCPWNALNRSLTLCATATTSTT